MVSGKPKYIKPFEVKRLESDWYNWHYSLHPMFPEDSRVKRHFRDDTANGLTMCIIAFLQINGCQAERINTMGRPIDNRRVVSDVVGNIRSVGRVSWINGNTTKGSSDISAIIKGRSVKIEVKVGRDRQSEAQRVYQMSVEKAGGIYYIARDFTQFVTWYKETFK